jgi:hypothetical protein
MAMSSGGVKEKEQERRTVPCERYLKAGAMNRSRGIKTPKGRCDLIATRGSEVGPKTVTHVARAR